MTAVRLTSMRALLTITLAALLQAIGPLRADGHELSAEVSEGQARPSVGSVEPVAVLTHDPLVMRLGKDEFRIAFGLQGVGCARAGCHGRVRYRVNWKTEDGSNHRETREVGYVVVPNSARTITVDRQYFDTSEAAHTTEVVQVLVTQISCLGGAEDVPAVSTLTDPSSP
jgi:hypothetical protein